MTSLRKSFIILFIVVGLVIPLAKQEETKAYGDSQGDKQYVYDMSEIFSDEEMEELTALCKKKSQKQKIDFAIVSTNDTGGKSPVTYSDDFMDENRMGYEDDGRWDKSCVLLLFDFENREVYINTTGIAILCVEDDDIETILDDVFEYIPHKDYYNAALEFLDTTDSIISSNKKKYANQYLDAWEEFNGTYEEFDRTYVNVTHNVFYSLRSPVRCLLISIVVAGIAVTVMTINNKAKMTANRFTYMNKRNLKVHVANDLYLRTTTRRYKISSESSGGGGHGGSFHSSGGGHSHGGGGRHM